MKPFIDSIAYARPHLTDAFGSIELDRRIQASVSDGLFLKAQRLARMNEMSMADWVRGIVEREVMQSMMPERPTDRCTSNGIDCIVHTVQKRGRK